MESCSITSWQTEGEKVEAVTYFLFLGSKITADGDCSHEIRRRLFLGRKAMTNQDSVLKSKRHHFVDKGPYSQGYGLSRSHIWFWDLDHKECRAPQNWCFWTVMLEKTLESPLDCKEVKSVNVPGNQPWILIRRIEAEALILWLPDMNSWLTGKDLTHEKRPWCWERLKAKGEEGSRRWNGWIALSIQWTWTWTNSRRWWGTGRPGMLQSMGSQRVGHN